MRREAGGVNTGVAIHNAETRAVTLELALCPNLYRASPAAALLSSLGQAVLQLPRTRRVETWLSDRERLWLRNLAALEPGTSAKLQHNAHHPSNTGEELRMDNQAKPQAHQANFRRERSFVYIDVRCALGSSPMGQGQGRLLGGSYRLCPWPQGGVGIPQRFSRHSHLVRQESLSLLQAPIPISGCNGKSYPVS